MPKESQNVDKRCTFSSLVIIYNHLYAMNDKRKATLSLFVESHITLELCAHVI